MEVGLAKGLAQSMQYDQRMQDERWYEEQMQRAKDRNLAELNAFEKDLEYMNAANSYDHGLIKGEADKTIKEIGALVGQNPDWRYNPEIRRQINEKKKYLKSNEHVLRGMASDDAFKQMNADLAEVAKNPAMHDTEAYQNLLRQKQNYNQYGHQEGLEGLKRDGGPQSFVYKKPQDFVSLNDEALKTASMIKSRKFKDHGNGGWEELVDENALTPAAMDFYNRHKRQIQVTYNPKTDEEGINYAKELMRPGIELKRKFGEPHYNNELEVLKYKAKMAAQQSGKPYDAYEFDVRKARGNKLNVDAVSEMLGTNPEAKIYDKNGAFVKGSEGRKFIPSGIFQQANNTTTNAKGERILKDRSKIGVFQGYVEYDENDLDNAGLSDAVMDRVVKKTITDVKGNKKDVYLVPAQVEVNPDNELLRGRYNAFSKMTNQQMNSLSQMQSETNEQTFNGLPIGATVERAGVLYQVTPNGLIQK